jgi:PKD repeat protein
VNEIFVSETVIFDGTFSYDPAGQHLKYSWDFDLSDGIFNEEEGSIIVHEFSSSGFYTVTLTVTDDDGMEDNASIDVIVKESSEEVISTPDTGKDDETPDSSIDVDGPEFETEESEPEIDGGGADPVVGVLILILLTMVGLLFLWFVNRAMRTS